MEESSREPYSNPTLMFVKFFIASFYQDMKQINAHGFQSTEKIPHRKFSFLCKPCPTVGDILNKMEYVLVTLGYNAKINGYHLYG